MQLTYTDNVLGFPGMLADTDLRDMISKMNANANSISFGLGVKAGTAAGTFDNVDSARAELLGVLAHDFAINNAAQTVQSVFTKGTGSILRRGRIVVAVEYAVTAGADAFVRIAQPGIADNTQVTLGTWGPRNDSGTCRHVKGAKFLTAAAKDGFAVLQLADDFGTYDLNQMGAQVGALAATTTIQLGSTPYTRHVIVDSVTLSAGLTAGDGTDHWTVALKNGSTTIATWDSNTAVNGAIVQGTPTALIMTSTAADTEVKPGQELTLVATKAASGASWTAGEVTVNVKVC
jgi:hypothetical protein